jgi:structural maintenance of chromosomes protein 6
VEDSVKRCEDAIKENNKKIQDERSRQDHGGERQHARDRLEELESSVTEFNSKELEFNDMIKQVTQDIKTEENKQKQARSHLEDRRSVLMEQKNNLSNLRRSKTSAMTVYHQNMPAVLDEIRRRSRSFHELPLGPLGASVQIKKEKWADICENLFGRNLNGFLVCDYHDATIMREILTSKRWYSILEMYLIKVMFQSSHPDAIFSIFDQVNLKKDSILFSVF